MIFRNEDRDEDREEPTSARQGRHFLFVAAKEELSLRAGGSREASGPRGHCAWRPHPHPGSIQSSGRDAPLNALTFALSDRRSGEIRSYARGKPSFWLCWIVGYGRREDLEKAPPVGRSLKISIPVLARPDQLIAIVTLDFCQGRVDGRPSPAAPCGCDSRSRFSVL